MAEVESAIEYEIRDRGEDDPVSRALSERLERLRERKHEAEEDMLSLLDEYYELAATHAAEKEAAKALGLDDRGLAFLTLVRTAAPGLGEERAVEVTKAIIDAVEKRASFEGWANRDDVLRAIRGDLIKLFAGSDDTKALARNDFLDELVSVAASPARS